MQLLTESKDEILIDEITRYEYDFVLGVTLWCNTGSWAWVDLSTPPDLESWHGPCTYITIFVHFFSMSKCLSFFVGHIFDQKMFTCAQYLCSYWQNNRLMYQSIGQSLWRHSWYKYDVIVGIGITSLPVIAQSIGSQHCRIIYLHLHCEMLISAWLKIPS